MSVGLVALLDDVAALAKVAAASLDDVGAQAAKAGTKSAGLIIDDAAVTPRFVTGLSPSRELPMIWRITLGSFRNKLLILLPLAMVLSAFAPWAITPLLMIGGCYLAYEGAEKIYEALFPHAAHKHETHTGAAPINPQALEDTKVKSAIRTDFILSAEIMAIALSTIPESGFWQQVIVLALVGVGITVLVYGGVALIVKADDAGVALVRKRRDAWWSRSVRGLGWGLVKGVPHFLRVLTVVGTAAMIWVGGGILVHGVAVFGWHWPEHTVEALAHAAAPWGGLAAFAATALGSAVAGLAAGAVLIPLTEYLLSPLWRAVKGVL